MANSDIKIIYFNIPGRAEISRLVLALADKKFEDVRVNGEKWREIKPDMPFGTCPVLVLDGEMYGQSKAIVIYLAKEFGFYGKTNLERLIIDQVLFLMEDFTREFGELFFFEKDDRKKEEGGRKLKEEVAPKYLGFFEKLLKDNHSGYFVGHNLSLADISVFDMYHGFLKPFVEGSIENYPLVKKLVDYVGRNERISAYMEKMK